MSVLDQTRDSNLQRLHGLLHTVGVDGNTLFDPPDFVKRASRGAVGAELSEDGAGVAFGNPRDRLFPVHTAPATWVSAVFFHTQKAAMSARDAEVIEKRIEAAAAHHGISGTVALVKAAVAREAARSEADLPDDAYALVLTLENGTKGRYLPVRNGDEVKAAAAYLRRNRADLRFDDRRVVAERILVKAAAFGVDLGEATSAIQTQAGVGTCAPGTVVDVLAGRAQAVKLAGRDPAGAALLEGLAKAAAANPAEAVRPAFLRKVASTVDRVDRDYKLGRLTGLRPPEDLFAVTLKAAADLVAGHVSLSSGDVYAKTALAAVPLTEVQAVMGAPFAAAVGAGGLFLDAEKLAGVAASMPRDDAELLGRLLARLGVQPAHKEAAHVSSGPLAAAGALAALAGMHRPAA